MEGVNLTQPFIGKYPITFRFGEKPEWYLKRMGEPHNGLDFALPEGTPIVACDVGKVLYVDAIPDAGGRGVILEHNWGRSLYWHTKEELVKVGEWIEVGEPIAFSGATGFATGPHLHFAIWTPNPKQYNIRGYIDPEPYIVDLEKPEEPKEKKNKIYVVLPGDSLWKIAEKVYGNGGYWRRIYDLNRDKIKDPNLIYPLQVLRLP